MTMTGFSTRWLFTVICMLSSGLLRAQPPAATTAKPEKLAPLPPIEFSQETLENGLRVLYVPLHQAPVVHVRVFYHVGSKDERADRQGFAHMFEHMMFRGSAHVKPEDHMKLVNDVGGICNAFTSWDQTTYVNTIPAEHLEMVLWLEADRMSSFKVSEEIYKTERKVVAEEWRMKMNQPYGSLYEEFVKRVFSKHSYRWTPIGNMEHLAAAAPNELQDFFNTYYVPDNAILTIAGDIDPAQVKPLVKKYFGWIPAGGKVPRNSPKEPEQTQATRAVVPARVPLPAVILAVKTPSFASQDNYALGLLAEIVGGSASSRLARRLVSGEEPMCTNANVMFMPLEDAGVFGAMGMLLSGKDPDKVEQIMREELMAVAEKGVTPEELQKAKAQYRQDAVLHRKTAEQLARNVGEEWLLGNDPARANAEVTKVLALTADDLKSVAAKYLQPQRLTSMLMVPDKTGETGKKIAAEAAAASKQEVTPPTAPVKPRQITFPGDYPRSAPISEPRTTAHFNIGKESAAGPARVIVMSDHRLPIVNLTVALRRGSHSEPAGKEGLGNLTAGMLRRGAGGMSYQQLNEHLDSRAISIAVADQGDYTTLVASCPVEQLAETVRLARLILREPTFDQAEFDKLKAQSLSNLSRALASPTKAAEDELESLLYGNSPLGRNATPKSIASLALSDVKDFYGKVYRPQDAIVILAGDVADSAGHSLAEQILTGWDGKLIESPAYDFGPSAKKRPIVLIDNPDAKQATVHIGRRAYTVQSPERFAGSLANQILSGGIESRLMRYVRAEKGLAYHAHGVFSPGRQGGAFIGQTDTAIETATDAIQAMFKVFDDMRHKPVADSELRESRLRVAGLLVMSMQTIEQQAERRLSVILNGFPADYWDHYVGYLKGVTADQIQELMKKYADIDSMAIVVAAPAAQVKEKLSKLGEVQIKPMPARTP